MDTELFQNTSENLRIPKVPKEPFLVWDMLESVKCLCDLADKNWEKL